MAFNLENLRNDLEALCSRQKAELSWDPAHQTQRTILGSTNEARVVFRVHLRKPHDTDSILTPEKRLHLLLKLVSKTVFDFFGYESDYMVVIHPGRTFERSTPAATPERMAELLAEATTNAISSTSVPCVITVATPAELKEEVEVSPADKAERLINSLISAGAGKRLLIKAVCEPDPLGMADHKHIMCMIRAEQDDADDSMVPLKVRLRSFANYAKQQFDAITDEADLRLSIGARSSPRDITPQEFADLIVRQYGVSHENIFRIGFWLYYK